VLAEPFDGADVERGAAATTLEGHPERAGPERTGPWLGKAA
jgi:hypothetical protein